MELMEEEVKGYSDSRELEEEEEELGEIITRREEINSSKQQHYPSFSLSSSSSTTNYTSLPHPPHHHHHHQNPWHAITHDHHHHHHHPESPNSSSVLGLQHHHHDSSPSNFINHRNHNQQLDFMDLSLSNNNTNNKEIPNESDLKNPALIEKEHMFDKVVTPSDVGKLNRLVIPKQHAEKYFPLDSSSNEKGLLLNFEDRNGKLWRFRYSYWNSSQSYVMTKGWSRFVKEKKLDAGDVVSFQRGVGELLRHRLYIDWKRRPNGFNSSATTVFSPFFLPNHHHLSIAGRFYSLPNSSHYHLPFQSGNSNATHQYYPYYNNNNNNNYSSSGSGSVFYLSSMADQRQVHQEGGNNVVSPMIIDSVPVGHQFHHHQHNREHGKISGGGGSGSSQGKMLRLFGVNMELCASSSSSSSNFASEDTKCSVSHVAVTNSSLQSLIVPHEDASLKGEASMVFDLDPSLQYGHR